MVLTFSVSANNRPSWHNYLEKMCKNIICCMSQSVRVLFCSVCIPTKRFSSINCFKCLLICWGCLPSVSSCTHESASMYSYSVSCQFISRNHHQTIYFFSLQAYVWFIMDCLMVMRELVQHLWQQISWSSICRSQCICFSSCLNIWVTQ